MSLGYSYTMDPADTTRAPAMTGHAMTEAAAFAIVEQLLTRDGSLFRGIVRDLGSMVPVAAECRRSRTPGQFIWRPVMLPLSPAMAG